mmetsp:Transcript_18466/g.45767  ORF Transcript_18466/g.45767 Transcript_18466/m.45767 type:complete len:995 (-) Transcript_18466:2335-5319(-)|eukprot:CAMPEP_0113612498 /NCGR_PEP_ID=MMETSP0017_2-20120614/6132_1 /TAXON_ID=2856 /ORGANISM="Cylindrotheca closterium" /LENGTH=994 /DNA_ID=CAMNT_0000521537 /DNA_START=160 /DNA_END=3144 /DNA_ORIENTATION=+ /assembly_acc=CAM_ASM_000147
MTGETPSLDELNAIMNLERKEAFDDPTSELSDHDDNESPEEKLMKIIDKPLPGIPKEKQDLFKKSQAARKKSSRTRYSYIASGGGTVTANRFQFADPLNPEKEEWRKTLNQSFNNPRDKNAAETNDFTGIQRVSSNSSSGASQNRNRLQKRLSARSLNMDGTESLTSTDTRNTTSERRGRRKNSSHSRSSLNPASVTSSLNDSDDKESSFSSSDYLEVPAQQDGGKPPVPRKVRRGSRTQPDDGGQPPKGRQSMRGRRRGSRDSQTMQAQTMQVKTSQQGPQGNNRQQGNNRPQGNNRQQSNIRQQGNNRQRANSQDAEGTRRSISKDAEGVRKANTRRSTSRGKMASFEDAWAETPDKEEEDTRVAPLRRGNSKKDINGKRRSARASANLASFEQAWDQVEADNGDLAAAATMETNLQRSMTSDSGNKKRTKREKIFELQAKCDRYKKEWIEASKDKKKVRKELQDVQVSIVSLNMQIDTQKAETEILQKQLTDTVQKLLEIKKVQEKERAEADETAQDLEQSKLDYTKAISDTRELRTRIDELEDSMSDKDKQIASLKNDLAESKKLIGELKLDLMHADDEGILLEKELKRLEEELEAYKTAAQKDQAEGGSEDNLRKAQSDIEKRLYEEKERRLNEKQLKLEAKIKEFEEQKEKAQQQQQERQKEMASQQMADSEKQKTRDEQRREMDSELTNHLKELEDNNMVLKGKLKSEQLQTTIKLKQRDETIEQLTKDMAEMKKQLAQRDADPDGLVALQREVETAKAESISVQEDLAEAQRMNGMLQEEIEDFQTTSGELRGELETLENEKRQFSTEMAKVKAKSDEWQKKSSHWTDKAFLWKEKAEYWEKVCREIDPYYKEGSSQVSPEKSEDPQAMMLQAAVAKKRSSAAANNPVRWNQWFNKPNGDQAEFQAKIQELQEQNNSQAELVKKLKSEIVRIQSSHKEETYNKQQKIIQVQREMEAVELSNTNLVKQLELARKLEHFAAQDLTTTL